MKVMIAMSGGVDSSVAAALLVEQGHQVVGVTMRLWGGQSDTGCCSVSDVDDARRVAQQLGIDHLVFNFTDDFNEHVVEPYVQAHAEGTTPNPCIECNRHLKFARLSERARLLGFDAVATGHHAQIVADDQGRLQLARGADRDKDQSYVVHMIDDRELGYTLFPVGSMTKADVRGHAARLQLRTATKPDSQDVCFISQSAGGRSTFLGDRIPFRRAVVVDKQGATVGETEAIELVTLGQRRGIGLVGGGPKRYVIDIDRQQGVVTVGDDSDLFVAGHAVDKLTWVHAEACGAHPDVLAQCSAHGTPQAASLNIGNDGAVEVRWQTAQRRIAAGQSIVLYDRSDRYVIAGGLVGRALTAA